MNARKPEAMHNSFAQEHAANDKWFSLKVLGTAGLWGVCILLLVMRYAAHVPARRLAWLSMLAFALLSGETIWQKISA